MSYLSKRGGSGKQRTKCYHKVFRGDKIKLTNVEAEVKTDQRQESAFPTYGSYSVTKIG